MSKCALVKPIGLLCQHAAEEMALNGFRGLCVLVCTCLCMYVKDCVYALVELCLWV